MPKEKEGIERLRRTGKDKSWFRQTEVGKVPEIRIETRKNRPIDASLLNPRFDNPRFSDKRPRTVYLAPGSKLELKAGVVFVQSAVYQYSDRLSDFYGQEECRDAWRRAQAKGRAENSASEQEAYLSKLLDDPRLRLVHLLIVVDGDGYPQRIFGYTTAGRQKK